MELVVEPDIYTPSMNDTGNYIDKIPSFNIIKKGLSCPCGSRRDKVYETHSVFASHIKTKTHQKWLENLNNNKTNYYIECEKMKDTIQNQRLVIARLEKDLTYRTQTVDWLTQQLKNSEKKIGNMNNMTNNCSTVDSLLDMDIN